MLSEGIFSKLRLDLFSKVAFKPVKRVVALFTGVNLEICCFFIETSYTTLAKSSSLCKRKGLLTQQLFILVTLSN